MTTQDADLIREAEIEADALHIAGLAHTGKLLRRAAARIAELTQPAPLALSKEDAQAWGRLVNECTGISNTGRAILAVDKLLRQRVTPLTDEQIAKALASAGLVPEDYRADGQIEPLVRAIEAEHGIGGEA